MENEERFKKLEEAVLLMKDLVVKHEDRIDGHDKKLSDFYKALEDSREDFNFKLNALIDAQMRNETDIAGLKESSKELNEASKSQLQRIEKLENK
jgi:hypothetical protein